MESFLSIMHLPPIILPKCKFFIVVRNGHIDFVISITRLWRVNSLYLQGFDNREARWIWMHYHKGGIQTIYCRRPFCKYNPSRVQSVIHDLLPGTKKHFPKRFIGHLHELFRSVSIYSPIVSALEYIHTFLVSWNVRYVDRQHAPIQHLRIKVFSKGNTYMPSNDQWDPSVISAGMNKFKEL